jgi:predicted ferric reductase
MNHEFWYLSRAAGFVAYLLLFVSVVLGVSMGTRLIERFARRNFVFDLHRFTTLLALAFTFFHVYVLLGDGRFRFSVWELSLPFLSPYRAWQTAVGVFTFYGMALVAGSFYVRRFSATGSGGPCTTSHSFCSPAPCCTASRLALTPR